MHDSIVCKDSEAVNNAYTRAINKINGLWLTHSSEEDECLIFNYDNNLCMDCNPKKVSEEQAIAILNHITEFGVNPL
jgi:uncharacterized lipoprotein YddW (UPF0748 family)